MSKRVRNMLVSLVALVAVGAIVAAVLLMPPSDSGNDDDTTATTTTTANADIVIVDKTKNEQGGEVAAPVIRVDIKNNADTYAIITRDDTSMAVEAYKDMAPDTTAITALCETLGYLTAVSTTSANEADSAYGLDQPTATLKVTYHDGEVVTLTIGAQSKGTQGYYCRREGDNTLYIIDTSIVDSVTVDGMQWIGKTIIAPPAVNADDEEGQAQLLNLWLTGSCRETPIEIITDTEAAYPGMTYVSSYILRSPYLRAIDSDYFTTISTNMTYLVASGVAAVHPTVEQLGEFGLADPYSVAAFTLAVVSTTSADNGGTKTSHYNDREHMVLLGGKNEDGDYYALVDQYDIVYTLSPDSVPWAQTQYIDVTSKLLFMKAITAVDSVTVTTDGQTKTFALEHRPDEEKRDDQMVVTADDKTYDTAEFRILYQLMIGIKRVADKEEGATASGEPVLKLEMAFNDGTEPMEIAIYPMTASRYLCVTADGEQSAVSISTVDAFLKQYTNYLNGDPVTSAY